MLGVEERVATIGGGAENRRTTDHRAWIVGLVACLLIASTGTVAFWDGQHIEPRDSPTYLAAAEALANGDGYRVPFGDRGKPVDFDSASSPVIDFPPGYPFLLSLGVRAGFDAADTARAVAILAAAAITGLFYWLTWKRTRSRWAGSVVGLIAGLWTLRMSVAVLSEAVFGLTITLALLAAGAFVTHRDRRWLASAAVLAAASVTIRTVGLAVVLAVTVAAWLGFSGWRDRILWSTGTVGAGLLAFAGLVAGGNRLMAWHPPDAASIKITIDAFVALIIPPFGNPTLRLAVFLLVVGSIGLLARRSRRRVRTTRKLRPEWIAAVAVLAQIGMVLATRALFDAQTDLNPRLAYPIALALLIVVVEYAARTDWVGRRGLLRTGVVLVAVLALVSAGWRTGAEAAELREPDGLRWASPSFQESGAVAFMRQNADEVTVFSNIPDGLWIAGVAGRGHYPVVYDPLSLAPNEDLATEMGRLADELESGDGVVFYDRDSDFGYLVEEPDLLQIASCVVVDDGRSVVLAAEGSRVCPR